MLEYFPVYRDYWLFYLVIAGGIAYLVAHERRIRHIQKKINEIYEIYFEEFLAYMERTS